MARINQTVIVAKFITLNVDLNLRTSTLHCTFYSNFIIRDKVIDDLPCKLLQAQI